MPDSGDLIGPYRLISRLGAGAMGEVWRARDERLDRYVALKVLPPDATGDFERRARMLREARAAAAIPHRNVVTLFDIVSHREDDILVMELVEGRTLSELLRTEGVPALATALRWLEEIADALVAAHACGVLHRDIKTANVMVGAAGVKVLDFGLARLRGDEAGPAIAASTSLPGQKIALDATMPSSPTAVGSPDGDLARYRTHAGQLIGTPLYMAPEQIAGGTPDERSEVFSVGVLAYELFTGKPPYAATSIDELFRQIEQDVPAPLVDQPSVVSELVERMLAKDPAARPSMLELRDAVSNARHVLFAPRARRWPLVIAGVLFAAAAIASFAWWRATRTSPARPGDKYVQRALEEYDVFYNDKAISSLRAALRVAPDHPRANAYMLLLGAASETDRAQALAGARRVRAQSAGKDRALVEAAIALVDAGPRAARASLATSPPDRELAFWAAELDYQARDYRAAGARYAELLADGVKTLRGRIYDHYSSVLLYLDDPVEALKIGKAYRDAFPGEADAVAVYATTLSAAGLNEQAIATAEDALRLSEGEDTLAGLAKVLAIAGQLDRARSLYQRALDRAGPARRPIRRAALALLQWISGDTEGARATVAPCLPDGSEAKLRERGACLFVAGVIDPTVRDAVISELEAMATASSDLQPAYGDPRALAELVRARGTFFGGACIIDPGRADLGGPTPAPERPFGYEVPLDFYAAYHVPFFATWAVCERAAELAALGDRPGAAMVLAPILVRVPNRWWLANAIKSYR